MLPRLKAAIRIAFGPRPSPERKYVVDLPENFDSGTLKDIAYAIRGQDYRPAIFIHGVLPRSGTNYLADLVSRHGDISAHPQRLWEFPLLSISDQISAAQNDFTRIYRRNAEVLLPYEFHACLASGMVKHLQEQTEPGKTMLFKDPHVRHIGLFRALFPRDYLVLLLRDGRDVVASSLRSFRKRSPARALLRYSREWHYATRAILELSHNETEQAQGRTMVVRYEDVFADPSGAMQKILAHAGLNTDRYNFAAIQNIPVRGSSQLADSASGMHWRPWKPSESFNPVGRWHDWPRRWKQCFKEVAGDTLIAAGYAKNNDW